MTKIRFSFRRTLQLVEYEPVQFGVDFESDSEPGEDVTSLIQRVYEKTASIYNEVQADVLSAFEAPGATRKTCHGGKPPPITPSAPIPPPPPKKK